MRLRRAPDHNIEPSTRLRRKKIRAKGTEIGTWHDAAWGSLRVCMLSRLLVLVLNAVGFLGGTLGAEEECAVEV